MYSVVVSECSIIIGDAISGLYSVMHNYDTGSYSRELLSEITSDDAVN